MLLFVWVKIPNQGYVPAILNCLENQNEHDNPGTSSAKNDLGFIPDFRLKIASNCVLMFNS